MPYATPTTLLSYPTYHILPSTPFILVSLHSSFTHIPLLPLSLLMSKYYLQTNSQAFLCYLSQPFPYLPLLASLCFLSDTSSAFTPGLSDEQMMARWALVHLSLSLVSFLSTPHETSHTHTTLVLLENPLGLVSSRHIHSRCFPKRLDLDRPRRIPLLCIC